MDKRHINRDENGESDDEPAGFLSTFNKHPAKAIEKKKEDEKESELIDEKFKSMDLTNDLA